jgi:hypothetical protein
MKWISVFLVGYIVFLGGVAAALWKLGVLERIGAGWTAIGAVIAIGIGLMISLRGSGEKQTIDIGRD